VKGWRRFLATIFAPHWFSVSIPKFGLNLLAGSNASPALLAAVRKAISAVQPKVFASRARAALACDARAELSRVNVPILYLLAKQDRVVPVSCLEEIRLIKPDLIVAEIDGPHLLLQREPQRAAIVIAVFIHQIEAAN
jgi:pimeloyl-ACP methyl ester carboxylesterase